MRLFNAVPRAFLFVIWGLIQIPFLFLFASLWHRFGVWQMRIFMRGTAWLFGMRFRLRGKLDKHRPLLLVSNHISILEIFAFPALFGCAFFAKSDTRNWPIIGWFIKKFGNVFVDRRPSKAAEVAEQIREHMRRAKNPLAVFPEGTTTNGDYVLPFKSAPFDSVPDSDVKIQPIVIFYRDRFGNRIPPQVLADEYAYFANEKQTQPPYAAKPLSAFQLVWRTLMRNGFVFEVHVLPAFDAAGMDRKQIAAALYEIVSRKFQELK